MRIKNSFLKDLTTLQKTLVQTEGAQDTSHYQLVNFRATYQFEIAKKIEMELGSDVNYETAYGVRILNLEQAIGDYALFTTMQLKIAKKLIIKPAVRIAYNSVYNAPIIPSINLKWSHKRLNLRASFARGFRAPSLKELYFDFVDINHNIQGNTNLMAEYSWNYSAFLTWIKPVKSSLFKFEYGIFYNDINDLITLGILDNNSYTYINIGDYSTFGNQAGISFRNNHLNAGLTTNYIGRYNPLSSDVSSLKPYFFSPEISLNVGYSFGKNKYNINLFYKYNGEIQSFYLTDEGIIETRTQKDYSILDLSFTSKWLNDKITVVLGVKNLLNVSDVQIIGQNGGVHSSTGNMNIARGISTFVSVKYNLQYDYKKKSSLIFFGLMLLTTGCHKEEIPIDKRPPGDFITNSVGIGEYYENQLYFDLESNSVISTNLKTAWDLAFESSKDGWHVILNSGRGMAIAKSELSFDDLNSTSDAIWNWDVPSGNLDSTAIGDWRDNSQVYIIDLGYDQDANHLGYKKIQFTNVTETDFTFVEGDLTDEIGTTSHLEKIN